MELSDEILKSAIDFSFELGRTKKHMSVEQIKQCAKAIGVMQIFCETGIEALSEEHRGR